MSNFEHIKRLMVLAVVIVIGFFTIRLFFIPKDFGKYGHYRAGSAEENMNRSLNYAGSSACQFCHEEKYSTWAAASHKTVSCENCHGALIKHAEDPASVKPQKPEGRNFCALCHGKNISRSRKFPQIILKKHNPGMECITCHNPHQPKL